jgi:hypothetical protein
MPAPGGVNRFAFFSTVNPTHTIGTVDCADR